MRRHRRADGSVTQIAVYLPDQVCDESAGEAHHKDGCGCHGHEVNGPRVVAFAHKVEVPRAAFVSI
jgi:hypothetical protein